jgi:anti-anti-sigma factor
VTGGADTTEACRRPDLSARSARIDEFIPVDYRGAIRFIFLQTRQGAADVNRRREFRTKEVVMAEALLRTRVSRYGPVQTLYASGELDIASGPVLERAVARALDGQGGEFHLDLGGLTFMDSSGAKALLSAHNRVESLGRRLVIVSPSGPVRRVLALMALEQVLDVRSPGEPASDIGGFFAYD